MIKETAIKLFGQKQVRSLWDNEKEKWYFSVVDVVGILTDSYNPNNYWKVLKNRLLKEGSQLITNCNQLKIQSSDGKYYGTLQSVNSATEVHSFQKELTPNFSERHLYFRYVLEECILV